MLTQLASIDGLQIRYACNEWQFKEKILLLSPLPESILAFNPIWESLADRFDLLAIDLPGFGSSQGRTELYSSDAMADFIITVIEYFNFSMPHIVGPDIGTPIALFMAALHPAKIKSIVVSSGACIYPLQVDGVIKQIIEAADLSEFQKIPVEDIINASLSDLRNYKLPAEVREDYISCYEKGRLFQALQILRNFPVDLKKLDALIENIMIPVQIVWGDDDPIAPAENAYILHIRLPKSKLDILPTGHYVWEDHAIDFYNITSSWVNVGYLKV